MDDAPSAVVYNFVVKIDTHARSAPQRCGYCHDGGELVTCPAGCGVSLHADCRTELGRCTTLGCRAVAVSPPATNSAFLNLVEHAEGVLRRRAENVERELTGVVERLGGTDETTNPHDVIGAIDAAITRSRAALDLTGEREDRLLWTGAGPRDLEREQIEMSADDFSRRLAAIIGWPNATEQRRQIIEAARAGGLHLAANDVFVPSPRPDPPQELRGILERSEHAQRFNAMPCVCGCRRDRHATDLPNGNPCHDCGCRGFSGSAQTDEGHQRAHARGDYPHLRTPTPRVNDIYEADEAANQSVPGQERVSVTHGSNTVTGHNSHFMGLPSGAQVVFDGNPAVTYIVRSVVNDTTLRLTTPYLGPTSSTDTMLDLGLRGRGFGRPTVTITPRGRAIAQALERHEARKKWGCLGPLVAVFYGVAQMFQGSGVSVARTARCSTCGAIYFVKAGHECRARME